MTPSRFIATRARGTGSAACGFRRCARLGWRSDQTDAERGRKAFLGNASNPCRDRSLCRGDGRYVLRLSQVASEWRNTAMKVLIAAAVLLSCSDATASELLL